MKDLGKKYQRHRETSPRFQRLSVAPSAKFNAVCVMDTFEDIAGKDVL